MEIPTVSKSSRLQWRSSTARSDYDPNIDSIVRVEARRLRAKLKVYYEEGAGRSDPVLIGTAAGQLCPDLPLVGTRPQGLDQKSALQRSRAVRRLPCCRS